VVYAPRRHRVSSLKKKGGTKGLEREVSNFDKNCGGGAPSYRKGLGKSENTLRRKGGWASGTGIAAVNRPSGSQGGGPEKRALGETRRISVKKG